MLSGAHQALSFFSFSAGTLRPLGPSTVMRMRRCGTGCLREIAFDGEAALLALFETFGAALQRVPADAKRFVPGQRYATTKDLTFAIHVWPQFVEPGELSVFGIRALVRVGLNVVSVEVYVLAAPVSST